MRSFINKVKCVLYVRFIRCFRRNTRFFITETNCYTSVTARQLSCHDDCKRVEAVYRFTLRVKKLFAYLL